MTKPIYDKLPITVEAPGYRKPTGEFTFVIVTPRQYSDLAKAFMERISSTGVLFFRPCLPEEIDGVLSSGNGELPAAPASAAAHEVQVIDVETLAARLDMTPRNVQIMAGDNPPLLVRLDNVRGQYDMLGSYVALWKAYKELQRGQGDAHNHERTEAMRLKRMERELDYHERAGNLVNAEAVRSVIEKAKAAEKQQVLFMPKQLAPRLEGDPAVNEAVLEEWAYSFLKGQTEINITADVTPSPDVDKMPEMKKQKKKNRKGKK